MANRPFANHQKYPSHEERTERRERLRRDLFEKQAGLCWLCGKPMTLERGRHPGRLYATFDHVLPGAKGGTAYYTNLRLAHRMCNNARNDRATDSSEQSR